ncbi:MAG: hypothetical protein AAB355_01955 [Patescibacteria group bacterium]
MEDGPKGISLLVWFLIIMTVLWFVWFFTGGPERARTTNPGTFLNPPAPIDTGGSYGSPSDILNKNTYRPY